MMQNKIPWFNIISVVHINCLSITFALIMPYQTAECKHGFNSQNSIKTSCCNKLEEKHLIVLMTNKTSKCFVANFDYELPVAINMWKEKKAHRIYKNVS